LYHYSHYHASDITPAHVAAWLLFATRRVKGRFTLAVPTLPKQRWYPPKDEDDDDDEEEERVAWKVEGLAVAVEEMEAMVEKDDVQEEEEEGEEEEESVLFAELPCSTRMKEMSLTLGKGGAGAFTLSRISCSATSGWRKPAVATTSASTTCSRGSGGATSMASHGGRHTCRR
jgi:hypothetical protein